ncbi:MAG: hypothetical protein U0168_13400 [Nannocystaceae bacterium]
MHLAARGRDGFEQLLLGERFGQEAVGACRHRALDVVGGRVGADHQHRDLGLPRSAAHEPGQLDAVDVGQG